MKPEYHQSKLKFYYSCPKMFTLSQDHDPEFGSGTEMIMREGQLFEGYVLGFKDDKNEKELIGRKKPETIQFIKNQAEYVRGILGGMEYNGKLLNSYVKLQHDLPEYSLVGEADHIGQINWAIIKLIHPEAIPEEKTINDLKYTGDIQRVWWEKQNFADYFQALMYVGIHFLNTGELLPFVYIVVENSYIPPLMRIEKVFIQESDIRTKLLPFIDKVHSDLFKEPIPSFETCAGGKNKGRCWFLQHCQEGRAFMAGYKLMDFLKLNYEKSGDY